MTDANTPQPPPTPSSGDVWLEVIADMRERRLFGIEKYGTPLQMNNGRDALTDAYQEALDMCVYLRQAMMERQFKTNEIARLTALVASLTERCAGQSEALARRAERSPA